MWAPSSSELGIGIATTTGSSSSSSTLRDRLVVVKIAGELQVTVAIDDNAGVGDECHCHRRRSWKWWRVVAIFVIDTVGSSWSLSMLRENGCREHQRRCGRKLVMGFAMETIGSQALTCHVVDASERWRMRASRISEG